MFGCGVLKRGVPESVRFSTDNIPSTYFGTGPSLIETRCTQREQNARLHVTSLSSDIKYCKEDNKPNM